MGLPTDKIIRQINQKNKEGFKYLYDYYYPSLCSFSYRFLKNKQEAEDVVQDVFLRLWKSKAKFNSVKSLSAFLYNSVKNASLNQLRYSAKFSDEGLNGKQPQNLQMPDESSVQQILIEEEYHRQIYSAINKLSPERRNIILLSMDGLSNKEIARPMGISVNTIKTLKRKAYQFLRSELSSEEAL
jgi:RNA polymerase sigma-70 factor (family 1)